MVEEFINVILIYDNEIKENHLFIDPFEAEKKFVEMCEQYGSQSGDTIEDFLEDGYKELPNGTLYIHWPDLR